MVQIGTLSWKVQVEEAAEAKKQAEDVGEKVENAKDAMESADEQTEGLSDKFGGLKDVQDAAGKGFDKMNAKAGFLGTAISFVVSTIGTLAGVISSTTALILGVGVASIIAFALAWKNNFGGIRDRGKKFIEWLKGAFEGLVSYVTAAIGAFTGGLEDSGATLSDLETIYAAYLDGVIAGFKTFWGIVKPIIMAIGPVMIAAAGIVGRVVGEIVEWLAILERKFGVVSFIVGVVAKMIAIFAAAVVIIKVIGAIVSIAITLVSVFGTIISVIGTVVSVITTLISIVMTVVSVIGTLIATLNPISLIIIGIIAVIVGLYAAWKTNFFGIRDIVNNVVSTMRDKFEGFVDWLSGVPDKLIGFFSDIGKGFASQFKKAFNNAIPDKFTIPSVNIPGGGKIGGDSIDLPELDTGGIIQQSGMAVVHEGEAVVPADVTRNMGMDGSSGGDGGGANKVEINVGGIEIGDQTLDISQLSRNDLRRLAQEIAAQLGDEVRSVV